MPSQCSLSLKVKQVLTKVDIAFSQTHTNKDTTMIFINFFKPNHNLNLVLALNFSGLSLREPVICPHS